MECKGNLTLHHVQWRPLNQLAFWKWWLYSNSLYMMGNWVKRVLQTSKWSSIYSSGYMLKFLKNRAIFWQPWILIKLDQANCENPPWEIFTSEKYSPWNWKQNFTQENLDAWLRYRRRCKVIRQIISTLQCKIQWEIYHFFPAITFDWSVLPFKGQCSWATFWKLFLGIPHLPIVFTLHVLLWLRGHPSHEYT